MNSFLINKILFKIFILESLIIFKQIRFRIKKLWKWYFEFYCQGKSAFILYFLWYINKIKEALKREYRPWHTLILNAVKRHRCCFKRFSCASIHSQKSRCFVKGSHLWHRGEICRPQFQQTEIIAFYVSSSATGQRRDSRTKRSRVSTLLHGVRLTFLNLTLKILNAHADKN